MRGFLFEASSDEPLHETQDRVHAELMKALRRNDQADRMAQFVAWLDPPDDVGVDGPAAIVMLDLEDRVLTDDHTEGSG